MSPPRLWGRGLAPGERTDTGRALCLAWAALSFDAHDVSPARHNVAGRACLLSLPLGGKGEAYRQYHRCGDE